MIPHGHAEMRALAELCTVADRGVVNGWSVDEWTLDESLVVEVANLYRAACLVPPSITEKMKNRVMANGISLERILVSDETARAEITRSDATELSAAASLLAIDSWPESTLQMPNVPKMSRRKSDSGIDVIAVELANGATSEELVDGDQLYLASVKHSVDSKASGARYALASSLQAELDPTYLATQLRVLHAHLLRDGYTEPDAERIFLFIENIDKPHHFHVHGAIGADLNAHTALISDLSNLPICADGERSVRLMLFPEIASLHERCA